MQKVDNNLGFADLALAKSFKHNRSLKTMTDLAGAINWNRIEEILLNHFTADIQNNLLQRSLFGTISSLPNLFSLLSLSLLRSWSPTFD